MLEVDTLLLSAAAKHQKRDNGKHYTSPLPDIQLLTEYQQGTNKNHYGTGGIDWANYCQRQVLHTEISCEPRRQYDAALQKDILVTFPSA